MQCKPTVKDIYDYINSIAPFDRQCEWDNSGLLVGNPDASVNKIGVVLDITSDAVKYAAESGIDLIVSHHPVIFRAAKRFLDGDPAFLLAQNGISAICAHTSLDIANGGVNDALAEALGFENAASFCEGEAEMLRAADINETDGESLAKLVAKKLSAGVRLADCGKRIKRVALCGGSGGDFIEYAASAGCDAYITGDLSHHDFLKSAECGITLIAAGHFETETIVLKPLIEYLQNHTEGVQYILAEANIPVFREV